MNDTSKLKNLYDLEHQRIVNSLIGKDTKILSANNRLPKGYKFILGENSEVEI